MPEKIINSEINYQLISKCYTDRSTSRLSSDGISTISSDDSSRSMSVSTTPTMQPTVTVKSNLPRYNSQPRPITPSQPI